MYKLKNKIMVTLFFLMINQSAWSQVVNLYCQGRYATGELLQLRLDIDFKNNQLLSANTVTPINIDDFNIIWRSEANGIQFESVLNRWTGELSATMIEVNDIKPNFLSGVCETSDKIKF